MEMLRYFWDSASALDPRTHSLDEGVRFPICQPDAPTQVCIDAGLHQVEVDDLEVSVTFADFDDYWSPFLGGQGPAPGYVAGLGTTDRIALEEHLRASMPLREEGPFSLVARAWVVRAIP